ncbi:RelA/SpoT domain-containing protein [Stutzerimonas degradans]|uniref:RelA/SpoT domain-containing protein n=1 Tax=Stutzerimonas degradans TaxID=2968968 RepID=UPI0013F4BF2A|nr:hypothetical protein [Stutzerimonas degradans]NHC09781.1 hypothetical protein [Stutzerimonas degradans]
MLDQLTQEQFMAANRICEEEWQAARITWDELIAIGKDHASNLEALSQTAAYIGNIIQKYDRVHSVRWRVKDEQHLMEKIVRKRATKESKYEEISVHNYHEIVTDLVGVRALHLFKDDFLTIDQSIRHNWDILETPTVYTREGDREQEVADVAFETRRHPKGYRSVHYILATQPLKRKISVEVQVRTIFEEGWSEIDHKIRYPNFSDEKLVEFFLQTFNRIAGSADEMGSFVKSLASQLKESQDQIHSTMLERDDAIAQMEGTIESLEAIKSQDAKSQQMISKLKSEIIALKSSLRSPSAIDELARGTLYPDMEALNKAMQSVNKFTTKAMLFKKNNHLNLDEDF